MIKVAETFGETGVNQQFTPSVLYALVAPDTTEEVRAEIVGRAKSGERVNVAEVEAAKAKAKQTAYVVEHGVKALVDAVDRGEVSLSAAVAFVRHQPTVQTALIAKALGSVAEAVTKANAEVKDKADRAIADEEEGDKAKARGRPSTSRSAKKPRTRSDSQMALAQFKYAVNHWFPQMDDDAKREAAEYVIAKGGATVP